MKVSNGMKNGKESLVNKRINIATALNSLYVKYAYVMLTSLFENQSDANIHIFILYSDLEQKDMECLQSLVYKYEMNIHYLLIDKKLFPTELPTTKDWSLEAYYRLMLLDILPADVDRILYLDVDMIINKSIEELYWSDFENYLFCVCRDMPTSFPTSDVRDEIFKEYIGQGFNYFNSGMMLWNIGKLRGLYHFKDYMDLAKKLNYKMKAPDQDLLNAMHWNQVKYLDEYKYDLFAKIAYDFGIRYEDTKNETVIIHFAGMKPWHGGGSVHYEIEQLWWDYAKITPFYYELMEDFLHSSINDPYIYNTLSELFTVKNQLKNELAKSVSLCEKLMQLIDNQNG